MQSALALVFVALGPVLAIWTAFEVNSREGASNASLRVVLLADFVYVAVIAGLILRSISAQIIARRRQSAGSQMHLRLTGMFAIIALIPTVLVAVFATLTVNFGLEGWFSDRVRNVVGNSLEAAQAYEAEHRFNLTSDARILAEFLDAQKDRFPLISAGQLRDLLNRGQVQMQRELPEAYIIDGEAKLRARGERSYLFDYEAPSVEEIGEARAGRAVIIEDWDNNEFRALIQLRNFADRFLYVTRDVDGEILSLLDQTKETVGLYEQLERERGRLLFEFALVYLGFALIVILAAIWFGLWFAERLSRPLAQLVGAAERVAKGDLDFKVAEAPGDDEFATLSRGFNTMTREVKSQRDALIEAHEETERRRRLFDSILSSVTAGVIGLDAEGRIEMMNRAGADLLSLDNLLPSEVHIEQAVPEFGALFSRLESSIQGVSQGEVRIIRSGREETLLVRMAQRAGASGALEGYVVTFDDVSDLVQAQRTAAWGDVARRIAHEIKNPLTPIQLSAERLRRKFTPLVGEEDAAALAQYSDVIIRQTGDLRRIVDEFSKFARMPAPERRASDILRLIRDTVHLQESGRPDIRYSLDLPETTVLAMIDETMIGQALTNLMKNAAEATDETKDRDGYQGEIRVIVSHVEGALLIQIQDNGIGLPQESRQRLFEPYVTNREKGTGLGLSIVKKIIEEHAGKLELMDAPPFEDGGHQGAEARILLPVSETGYLTEPEENRATA
ncbi:sensor histidine kinase NtrY-like [Algicella marina]|uniref:histidine kinase n=1 Tax=Algicella marina TaxID=2683284 RepID=A0A6P1T2S3_9RHOB|nr:PAS domain-containing sensor histidine kinase [Algicella marina]QHQ34802.1 HAMP domain-containing protein [Algicella marina]